MLIMKMHKSMMMNICSMIMMMNVMKWGRLQMLIIMLIGLMMIMMVLILLDLSYFIFT